MSVTMGLVVLVVVLVPIVIGWGVVARYSLDERRRRQERAEREASAAALRELDRELDLAWEDEMQRLRGCP